MWFSSSAALKALLFLLTAVNIDAFWRMPCLARSGLARIDPLVAYGSISEHAHAIHGSSGTSPPLKDLFQDVSKYLSSVFETRGVSIYVHNPLLTHIM